MSGSAAISAARVKRRYITSYSTMAMRSLLRWAGERHARLSRRRTIRGPNGLAPITSSNALAELYAPPMDCLPLSTTESCAKELASIERNGEALLLVDVRHARAEAPLS